MRCESAVESENTVNLLAKKAIGNYLRNLLVFFSVKSVILGFKVY